MSATDEDVANISYWGKRWDENRTGWHRPVVNPALKKYFKQLTNSDIPENFEESDFKCTLKNEQFYVPLCGKTMDIPFLLRVGYRVFGVEAVKSAIEALATEHSLDLKLNEKESIYSTHDGRLRIYYGDLFTCPLEKWGPYDYVWDRGALIAVEYVARKPYIAAMQRALTNPETKKCMLKYTKKLSL